jgi:hypothetical protein
MLVHRTSAHARAATNGFIGGLLLVAVAALAALVMWPSRAPTFLDSTVARLRAENWDRYAPFALAAAAALAAASFTYAIVRARRWNLEREINRVSAALSTTDPSMVDPATDTRHVATGVPRPRIQWVGGASGAMPKLRALTPTTNILGWPRLEITYLRLFNNQYRHVSFVKGAWREFGSVSMIRSAVSMTSKEAQRSRRTGIESLFVTTRPQLESELAAVGTAPSFGRGRVDAGPTRVSVRDRYGAYPMRSVLCADSTWRAAVDRLLDTADLVVLDLSGFTDRRAGTRYELQRVLDRVPAERLVFLADPMSKNKILEEAIGDAWSRMSTDSPNVAHPEVPVWIARVDRLVRTVDEKHNTTMVELVTSRKETRRLMTAVQQRLRDARPIVDQSNRTSPQGTSDDVDPWQAYGLSGSPAPAPDARGEHRVPDASPGSIEDSRRRPARRIFAISVAVLVIAGAAVAFAMFADETQSAATTTLARSNTESSVNCPTPVEDVLEFGDGIPEPCESVRLAQQHLTALGYLVEDDGRFGPKTEAAVQSFQADEGLPSDGLLGPETWNRMIERLDAAP